ncbi:MAG: PilT/PilU family type 4a pilus ATPase [Candidatus Omnitrophota bacterium]
MAGDQIKVLVIEDNSEYADLIQEVLMRGKEPFRIQRADRLSVGLASLAQGDIDAILLDLALPDSQGFETFTKVHAQAPQVPVVILSGNNDESFALDAISHGAQDYLVKGEGEAKILPRVMRYAIERKKAETEEGGIIKELSTNGASAGAGTGFSEAAALSVADKCRMCELFPWLDEALEAKASDLFITVGEAPMLKIFGQFRKIGNVPVSVAKMSLILDSILTKSQSNRFFKDGHEVDLALDVDGLSRFRVNVFKSREGASLAFRPIPRHLPSLDELGLPPILHDLSRLTKGLVLITGPTGNGKSTTLAALLNEVNKRDERHIITIEDPIEFVIPHQKSLVHQREVEMHTRSFADGLKSALRENPDIIMVGELRDPESITLAVRAAETGHLVFSTLHSGTAVQAITRILDVFEPSAKSQVQVQLAQSLQGIVTQRLFKRRDEKGMALATEMLIPTPAIRNLIRVDQLAQIKMYLEMGKDAGMRSMEQSIRELLKEGVIGMEALEELKAGGAIQI